MTRARFEPGEIVIADIHDYTAIDARSGPYGKHRPAVLVYEQTTPNRAPGARRWAVMGLTTVTHYLDGTPRVVCPPQTDTIGPGRSWLWGTLTGVPETSILDHIAWATDDLVDVIADLVDLRPWQAEDMRPQARYDRRRSAVRRPA